MKSTKRKVIAIILVLCLVVCLISGCGGNKDKESYTVGVLQYGSHPSLDNCYEGLSKALSEQFGDKLTLDLQNGSFDASTCDTIAKNMVSKNYDMIIAIATPAAVSAYSAAANSDIPVVFCAVSDPVKAGFVDSSDAPGGNCTGTSDILDFDSQLALIKALQPEAKKIGVLYTTSEANSISQLAVFESKASALGLEVISQGVQSAADIPQAAASLCPKVDLLNNFTDNNVVNNLSIVLEQSEAAGIPVYGSEIEQVLKGCLAAMSIDYVSLGQVTGEMASQILLGEDPSTMPVRQISQAQAVINTDTAEAFGITVPDEYASSQFVTDEK